MTDLAHECVGVTNMDTGMVHYVDIPTAIAMHLLSVGIGERVRFPASNLGWSEFTVTETYGSCVCLADNRRSFQVDLAADASEGFTSHLQQREVA